MRLFVIFFLINLYSFITYGYETNIPCNGSCTPKLKDHANYISDHIKTFGCDSTLSSSDTQFTIKSNKCQLLKMGSGQKCPPNSKSELGAIQYDICVYQDSDIAPLEKGSYKRYPCSPQACTGTVATCCPEEHKKATQLAEAMNKQFGCGATVGKSLDENRSLPIISDKCEVKIKRPGKYPCSEGTVSRIMSGEEYRRFKVCLKSESDGSSKENKKSSTTTK